MAGVIDSQLESALDHTSKCCLHDVGQGEHLAQGHAEGLPAPAAAEAA